MKKVISVIIILFSLFTYSQKNGNQPIKKVYVSINHYKEKYNKALTKEDSLNFMFRDKDTLVLVKDYIRAKGKEVLYEYKDSTFLHFYKKVVFNYTDSSAYKKSRMRYWKDPIKIYFSKSIPKKTKKQLMLFAKSIEKQVDSLKINEVKKVENSNYIIYCLGDYEYESNLSDYKYSQFYTYWNGSNQIYKNAIKINLDEFFNDKLRIDKLKAFFFQSLGYFNLINDFSCESYFSNCYSPNKKISRLDLELLKYHYSYGICKGTSLSTFETQHKRAKASMKKKHTRVSFFHEY